MTEQQPEVPAVPELHADLLESAWGVIANAGWDDCAKTPGWQEAAARWRDDYFRWTDLHLRPGGYQTWEELALSLTRERDALFAELAALKRASEEEAPAIPPAPVAAVFDREAAGRLVHDTRLACEAERAALEGRHRFDLKPWEQRTYEQQETDMRIAEVVAAAIRDGSEEKAKLAAIATYCREECVVMDEGVKLTAIVRASDILGIIGDGGGVA